MPQHTSQELIQGIIEECHAQFHRLPKHGKPSKKSNGQAEWTILAGIVATTPVTHPTTQNTDADTDRSFNDDDAASGSWDVECISLATGSKCLPQSKLSPRGDLVNDCHAEVLARRGFNRWCLQEMQSCISHPANAKNKFRYKGDRDEASEESPLFELVDPRTQFHLYVSQAPCGDATTASLAETQTTESRNAFLSGQKPLEKTQENVRRSEKDQIAGSKHPRDTAGTESADTSSLKHPKLDAALTKAQGCDPGTNFDLRECNHTLGFRRGRIDYDSVGVLRTKPGRVDSEPTMSMSCSDKIARWNVLGLTSAVVAPFLKPIFLQSVITRELFDASALERALFDRIQKCACQGSANASDKSDSNELSVTPHHVQLYESAIPFDFSRETVSAQARKEGNSIPPVASSSSISWVASEPSTVEVLINGCKAGASAKQPIQAKSRSRLCKISMFNSSVSLWRSIPEAAQNNDLVQCMVRPMAEKEVKAKMEDITYGEWKRLAKGYNASKEHLFQGVFRNWIRGDKTLEQFNINGDS